MHNKQDQTEKNIPMKNKKLSKKSSIKRTNEVIPEIEVKWNGEIRNLFDVPVGISDAELISSAVLKFMQFKMKLGGRKHIYPNMKKSSLKNLKESSTKGANESIRGVLHLENEEHFQKMAMSKGSNALESKITFLEDMDHVLKRKDFELLKAEKTNQKLRNRILSLEKKMKANGLSTDVATCIDPDVLYGPFSGWAEDASCYFSFKSRSLTYKDEEVKYSAIVGIDRKNNLVGDQVINYGFLIEFENGEKENWNIEHEIDVAPFEEALLQAVRDGIVVKKKIRKRKKRRRRKKTKEIGT